MFKNKLKESTNSRTTLLIFLIGVTSLTNIWICHRIVRIVSLESNEPTGAIKSFKKSKMFKFDSAWGASFDEHSVERYILEIYGLNPVILHTFFVPEKTADKLIPVLLQDPLKPELNKLYLQADCAAL